MVKLYRHVATLFQAHPTAVKGSLNAEEIGRSILVALGSSAGLGVLIAILGAVQSQVAVLVPNPIGAAVISYVLVQVVDVLHRLQQGETPANAVVEAFLNTPPPQ